MDNEPGTSMESDKELPTLGGKGLTTCSERKRKGGGTSCCIPTCDSNTKRNPELSFYQFPTDRKLRKMWLHWVGRANFVQNKYHKVCSRHFEGGKTCLHNIPIIVPKLILPTPTKPRPTPKCRDRAITKQEYRITTVR